MCYILHSCLDDAICGLGSIRRFSHRLSTWWARHSGPFLSTRNDVLGRKFRRLLRSWYVGKKLYVGNLSYGVTNANLEELFAPFGAVRSAQVIQDRDTGRSKGFGFVEMDNDNAARDAIAGLHDKEHDGRPLTVNEAKPREDRGGGGGGGGRRRY
jgi:hypothetical protein